MLELKMFENALFCVFAENLGVVDQRFECVVQFSFDFTNRKIKSCMHTG